MHNAPVIVEHPPCLGIVEGLIRTYLPRSGESADKAGFLAVDEGHPKLARHLEDLMLLMSVQPDGNWAGFKLTVDSAFPQYDTNLSLPLDPLKHWGKP